MIWRRNSCAWGRRERIEEEEEEEEEEDDDDEKEEEPLTCVRIQMACCFLKDTLEASD
jgi:hypothetical protein